MFNLIKNSTTIIYDSIIIGTDYRIANIMTLEMYLIYHRIVFYNIGHCMDLVELETCGSNDIPSCSQSYKTSFVGNLDFPKIKKLKNVCSGVWACTKR